MDVTLPDGTTVKGVPDGTTKAQLATKLKANGRDVPADWLAPPESPQKGATGAGDTSIASKVGGGIREAVGSIAEPLMAMGSGMAGKVAGDVAGLGAIPLHAAGAIQTDPTKVQQNVQQAMQYQPRTQAGASPYNPLNFIPRGLAYPFQAAGGAVKSAIGEQTPGKSMAGNAAQAGIEQILPLLLGIKGGPAGADAAATGLKSGAREMMQSALKPSEKAQKTGKASAAIDTLLDTGTNVTKGGVQKLQDRVNVLNDRIADVIKNSPAQIDKVAVTKDMQGLVDKFVKQVKPLDDVRAIQKAWDEFLEHPLLTGDKIPVQLAQEMKQGTTRSLGDKAYGELKTADKEAQKTLARGLKDEIARVAPEVRPLNAEDSKLLNALSLTEKRVLMSANKNPAGLGWLSPNPAKMAAYLADRSELFKSLIARMLNTGSKAMGPVGAAAPALGGIVANQPTGSPVQQ